MQDRNQNYQNNNTYQETERIIRRRDRQKYLEELAELQNEEASAFSKIFWTAVSFLIVEPLATAGAIYYFWDQLKTASQQNTRIFNFGSNLKYTAIALAISFLLTSLTLLYNLWRVSSLKSRIAKIRYKIARLEGRLT